MYQTKDCKYILLETEIEKGIFKCADTASELCQDLINRILVNLKDEDGKERLKIGQILNHPWLKDEEPCKVFTVNEA
jgi:hypothetical protein